MQPIFRRLALSGTLFPSLRAASFVATVIVSVGVSSATSSDAHAQGTYDVSTVKQAKPGENGMMLNWAHAELKAKNVPVAWIMTSAFHARADQITALPSWAKDQRFDITAKLTDTDEATLEKMTPDQHRALLLALLIERFGLKYHVETRELAVYDLVPAKDGLKLTPAADSAIRLRAFMANVVVVLHGAITRS